MQKPIEQKNPAFIKKYWYVFLLIIIFVVLSISMMLRILTSRIPVQENTWNGVTPGYSSLTDITSVFGSPQENFQTEHGNTLLFESSFPTQRNIVILNDNQKVSFMQEYLVYDPEHTTEQYISQFGQPDTVMVDETTGDAFHAYVFLSKGVVIVAHTADNTVQQRWYFEPTSLQSFLNTWGKDLVEIGQAHEPEVFFYSQE